MNWRGGLFRLWAVLTLGWILATGWLVLPTRDIGFAALVLFGPPLLLLAFGGAGLWIAAGFKKR